jgi:hypothetical protein
MSSFPLCDCLVMWWTHLLLTRLGPSRAPTNRAHHHRSRPGGTGTCTTARTTTATTPRPRPSRCVAKPKRNNKRWGLSEAYQGGGGGEGRERARAETRGASDASTARWLLTPSHNAIQPTHKPTPIATAYNIYIHTYPKHRATSSTSSTPTSSTRPRRRSSSSSRARTPTSASSASTPVRACSV